jgi:hypothetical protein
VLNPESGNHSIRDSLPVRLERLPHLQVHTSNTPIANTKDQPRGSCLPASRTLKLSACALPLGATCKNATSAAALCQLEPVTYPLLCHLACCWAMIPQQLIQDIHFHLFKLFLCDLSFCISLLQYFQR